MIIGIDGNEANVANKVGIGEYAFELLKQFEKYQISNIKYQIYLKNPPLRNLPKETIQWRYKIISPRKFWTQFGLPLSLYLNRPQPDVFFSPTHYSPRFSPVPTVISIMDLSYIYFPETFKRRDLYQLKYWTSYSVNKAKKVITISESSKNDIMNYYKIAKDKIVVIYPGIKKISNFQFQVSNMNKLKEKYSVEGDYVLFVGTLQPRKNIERLIEAFSKISNINRPDGGQMSRIEEKKLSLVIVGKKGWLYEEILKAPEKFGIEDKVKFLDFVSDEDLPYFYKNAICYILPSLYEGFGLPVLEAMKYGCPVLASNVSSLPEAGGKAALYFDPYNVGDIAEKIRVVLEDNKLREVMRRKGFDQVKKFSWEKAGKETLEVLEEVGRKR